jgi:predicted amidophosphoribosyltransferase
VTTLLVKTGETPQMKDLPSRNARIEALKSTFAFNDVLPVGKHDVLIIDDLYDLGSSLEVAVQVLRGYERIGKIYVVTLTRTT